MLRAALSIGLLTISFAAPAATPSLAPPEPQPQQPQPRAEEAQRYSFSAQVPELEVDTRGEVRVGVVAAKNFVLDRAFPFELSFVPEVADEALVVKRTRYQAADGKWGEGDKSLGWTVEVMARKVGDHPVKVKMKLRVCTASTDLGEDCTVAEAEMRLVVVVKG